MSKKILKVIAIIALIAIVAMFIPIFGGGRSTVDSETAKNTACQIMISRGCAVSPNDITISDFDANRDGELNPGLIWDPPTSGCGVTGSGDDNLRSLCDCFYSTQDVTMCMEICGC